MSPSELVKSLTSELNTGSKLAPNTAGQQEQKLSLEEEIFRLKLAWIMAKSDDEKQRVSRQIRGLLGLTPKNT